MSGSNEPAHMAFCRMQEAGGPKFFVVSKWFEDHFSIQATDGQMLWAAESVTRPPQHVLKEDEWIRKAKEALSPDHGSADVTYKLKAGELDGGELEVVWAVGDGEKVAGLRGSCRLPPASRGMPSLLDSLFDHTLQLQASVSRLTRDTGELGSLLEKSKEAVQKHLAAKNALEADLYARVKVLINEKKRKARELREELEAAERDGGETDDDQSQQQTDETDGEDEGGSFEAGLGGGASPPAHLAPVRRRGKPPAH